MLLVEFLWALHFLPAFTCVASWVYLYVYIQVVCTSLCLYLWGIRAQPHYWLDLGTWSCSSLAFARLPDLQLPAISTATQVFLKAAHTAWSLQNGFLFAYYLFIRINLFFLAFFLPSLRYLPGSVTVHKSWLDPVPFSFFQANPSGLLCRESQFMGSFPIVFSAYLS